MKKFLLPGIIFALLSGVLYTQTTQVDRSRERRERLIRADERRREESAKTQATPALRRTVMNVDVRIALTKMEYSTFAEAQANAVGWVMDGEPLWLNLRFNGKASDYTYPQPDHEVPGKVHSVFFAEIGPQGDITALTQFTLNLSAAELSASELKFNLAPGVHGKNRSLPIFLKTADNARPGVWRNEFRIANSPVVPRGPNDFLAKSAIVLDLSRDHTKYRRMWADYDSIMLRGTPDVLKMPVPGRFFSDSVKREVTAKLAAVGIQTAKFYFSGDDWGENATSAYSLEPGYAVRKERRIFAAYTYQKFGSCLYGVAEITQALDVTASRFITSAIDLSNDFPINCELLK